MKPSPLAFEASRRRTLAGAIGALGVLLGCSSPVPRTASAPGAPSAPTNRGPAPGASSTPAPDFGAPVPEAPGREQTRELPLARPLTFERVLEEKVRSIALGRPRVAVLADEPWWFDQGRWRKIPLPERLRPAPGQAEQVDIFFGRDDKPRIMGWRPASGSAPAGHVYLRYMPQGWVADRSEVGKFTAGPAAPLYGVLGHDDPEVVCKPGDGCIIKRLTGWQTVPETLGPARVVLCGTAVWAVNEQHLAQLTAGGWTPRGEPVPWRAPGGVFEVPGRGVWVTEPLLDRIHRRENDRWSVETSPIAHPREIWASSARDVWLVGDGGAAHHDGDRWSRVEGVGAPLARALGKNAGDVWLGGDSGLWHGTR